jgi:anti-sigma factor RsiW
MSCLKIADIYAYLEEDLSAAQREEIERHLSVCPRCREAVEERKVLAEAASSLPDVETPADFTERVMAKIAPAKRHFPAWLAALGAGVSSLALFLVLAAVYRGESLLTLFARLNHSFWGYVKTPVVFLAKALTILALAGKVLSSLAQPVFKGLALLTTLIGPGTQIFIITLSVILFIALFCILRKKHMLGEKI